MPAVGFRCPDGATIAIEECLTEGGCRMSNRCATRNYLRMVSRERQWTGKPSCTQLIAGTMLAFLRITTDYAISPDDRAFMIHGSKSHAVLENYDDEFSLIEEKLDGKDTLVTGIFDVFEEENGKSVLVDYKTSGSYKVAKCLGFYVDQEETGEYYKSGKKKGEPKTRKVLKRDDSRIDRRDWELQLNFYRIELEKRGFAVDEMRVMCIVRDGNTYIARSRGVFRNVYYFKIARLDDKEVGEYFDRKRMNLLQALQSGQWEEPCSAQENWEGLRCERYCEVAEFCPLGKYLLRMKEVEEMPIRELSGIRRFPEVGRVRLGIIKKNEKGVEHPSELDHFRIDPKIASDVEAERITSIFHNLYGEEPKSIDIMLPVSDLEVVFPQWYMRFTASGGLQCRGDGETAVCMSDQASEGLEMVENNSDGLRVVACEGQECRYYQEKACRRVATLNFLMPKLPGAGVWRMTTGSFYSIVNLNSCLEYIRTVAGRFHMIPLKLERREQLVKHNGKQRKHFILHINMEIELARLQRLAQIDPTRVMLSLPAIDKQQESVYLQETDEDAIHEVDATETVHKERPDDSEFGLEVAEVAGLLNESLDTFKLFVRDQYPDEVRFIGLFRAAKTSDSLARKDITKAYSEWQKKQEEAQMQAPETAEVEAPLITSEQRVTIKKLAEELFGEKALGKKKFQDVKREAIGTQKHMKDLTSPEADKVIGTLSFALDKLIGEQATKSEPSDLPFYDSAKV